MAHFLTTNWTDKIKTNPVANMILNSNRANMYRMKIYNLGFVPPKGKLITKGFIKYWQDEHIKSEGVFDVKGKKRMEGLYPSPAEYVQSYNSAIIAQRKEDEEKSGIEVKVDDYDDDASDLDNEYVDAIDADKDGVGPDLRYVDDEWQEGDMWANTYVDDYINIHHPKLRPEYITLITGRPLQIKPPSVFFSDL